MSEPICPSRKALLLVAAAHIAVGIALAIFMNYFIRDFPLLLPRQWYDSYWMPLSVACLVYLAEAVWVQLPTDWLYGLMITAPPYGWHAVVATTVYFENRASVALSEFMRIVLPALLLALSGAILSPAALRLAHSLRQAGNRYVRRRIGGCP